MSKWAIAGKNPTDREVLSWADEALCVCVSVCVVSAYEWVLKQFFSVKKEPSG